MDLILKSDNFTKKPQGTRHRPMELPSLNTALGAFSGWYFPKEDLSQIIQLMWETPAKNLEVSAQTDLA
jgi:hypothetical protein